MEKSLLMSGIKTSFKFFALVICHWSSAQISGTVIDAEKEKPIPYVNVWVKNTLIGSTTGVTGNFLINGAKVGDTLYISSLGYYTVEFPSKKENSIMLKPKIDELDEVVIMPMINSEDYSIQSFKKVKKNRNWYNNGHYSLARFYSYAPVYKKTPFIDKISLITLNSKKENVIFRIRLVTVDNNGQPSEIGLTESIVLECKKGVSEVSVDLKAERIIFPEDGFFIVVDRLNLKANESYNKFSKSNILQPAIGMERSEQEKNTWFGFGGKWMAPVEMGEFLGTNENIAVNIKLTN